MNVNFMSRIYKSKTLTMKDDREPITLEQAFDILWDGKSIRACYPPDYGSEEEDNIYDDGGILFITDIIFRDDFEKYSEEECRKLIYDYLRGYELYR